MTLDADDPINRWLEKVFVDAKPGHSQLTQLREKFKPPKPPFHLFIEVPETTSCRLRRRVYDKRG